MNGASAPIVPLFPTGPLSPEILPCSVLRQGHLAAIEKVFPVETLSPDMKMTLTFSRIIDFDDATNLFLKSSIFMRGS
jgi:hypothetical protein